MAEKNDKKRCNTLATLCWPCCNTCCTQHDRHENCNKRDNIIDISVGWAKCNMQHPSPSRVYFCTLSGDCCVAHSPLGGVVCNNSPSYSATNFSSLGGVAAGVVARLAGLIGASSVEAAQ